MTLLDTYLHERITLELISGKYVYQEELYYLAKRLSNLVMQNFEITKDVLSIYFQLDFYLEFYKELGILDLDNGGSK
jgi:hypothetical protein